MKKIEIPSSLYYKPTAILGYNKLFNFIIGGCGIGKTYGVKYYCMNQFITKGDQFIYMRRNQTDYKNTIQNFFAPFQNDGRVEVDKWKVTKDNKFMYEDKVAGYYQSLNELMRKGSEFPNVGNIIFDEFIPHGGYQRYLPDEMECFLGAYDAVCRYIRDVRVFFIANAVSMYTPYFLEIGYIANGKKFWTQKSEDGCGLANESVVELCSNDELATILGNTRFGKAIKGTRYGDYSLYNKTLNESSDFICKKSSTSILMSVFKIDGRDYTIWRDANGNMYISKTQTKSNDVLKYSVTESDKQIGYLSASVLHTSSIWKVFVNAYNYGYLFFEDSQCKAAAFTALKGGFIS